jgi:hypothetical protein
MVIDDAREDQRALTFVGKLPVRIPTVGANARLRRGTMSKKDVSQRSVWQGNGKSSRSE